MINDAAEAGRVFVALLCAGVFWTTVWFTIDSQPKWRFWPPVAAILMVLAVYVFSGLISGAPAAVAAIRP